MKKRVLKPWVNELLEWISITLMFAFLYGLGFILGLLQ